MAIGSGESEPTTTNLGQNNRLCLRSVDQTIGIPTSPANVSINIEAVHPIGRIPIPFGTQ